MVRGLRGIRGLKCPALTQRRPIWRCLNPRATYLAMWYLFQGTIFWLVCWTDWTWNWGDRSYAPAFLGWFAAFIASAIVQGLLNLKDGLPFRGIDGCPEPPNAFRKWLWR